MKARRLVIPASSNNDVAPSFLQGRVVRGEPLPRVALAPMADFQNDAEPRKLRTTLAFLVGIEGGGMPRDVFRVVLDLLILFGPVAA